MFLLMIIVTMILNVRRMRMTKSTIQASIGKLKNWFDAEEPVLINDLPFQRHISHGGFRLPWILIKIFYYSSRCCVLLARLAFLLFIQDMGPRPDPGASGDQEIKFYLPCPD